MTVNPILNMTTQGFDKLSIDKSSGSNGKVIGSFSDLLDNAMSQISEAITKSDKLSQDFAAGKTDNIHEVMIAAEKADIILQYALQIRTKILDAYNEIMRMQI